MREPLFPLISDPPVFDPQGRFTPATQPAQPLPRKGQRPTIAPVHHQLAKDARRAARRAEWQKLQWLL
jgi:hypothetical protein